MNSPNIPPESLPVKPEAVGDGRKIGEILLGEGLINREQLDITLQDQQTNPLYFGQLLMRRRWISERDLFHALGSQRGVEFYDVRDREIPPEVVDKLPREVALKLSVLPVEYRDGVLKVAMEDPLNNQLIGMMTELIPEKVRAGFTTRGDLHYAINRAYNNLVRSNPLVRDFFDGFAYLLEQPQFDSNRLIDLMMALAHLLGASDVHITFTHNDLRLALRIDGSLHGIPIPARRLRPDQINQLRNALKIRSGLDAAKKGSPQDGRLELEMDQGGIQARVATLPLVDGEKAVLRLIGRLEVRDFEQIGLSKEERTRIEPYLKRVGGLILVAGPTGSGKTTTLYALLSRVQTASRNVITIEDPVEARLPFASQVQVDRDRGLTFETALSAILRQDPDILLLGEIRDRESAAIAIESAMTGHLVLTSVHMDQAAGVVLRLLNMGVEPLALASALKLIIAQRLAPAICAECRELHPESVEFAGHLSLQPATKLYRGAGCKHCYFTGKSGRVAIFETIFADDNLRDVIVKNPSLTALTEQAKRSGARFFFDDARLKCVQGLIAPEDVLAVV